jgi:hypothetical protein
MDNPTGSNNQREFLGITQNECTIQGKVINDPVIQNDNYAFMQIKTSISEIGANGQWVDTIVEIPVITMDPKKVDVIQKYVKEGRVLLLSTFYKSWVNNGQPQHAFIIKKLTLGSKKWEPDQATTTPSLPVQ